jgi:large subunit ribosomal protein L6
MSRIGRQPVVVPDGVTVVLDNGVMAVTGPKGNLSRPIPEGIDVALADGEVHVTNTRSERRYRALHGLTRALLQNMVDGVTKGFVKRLEIQGVGYKAEQREFGLHLSLGLSHPVEYRSPDGVTCSAESNTVVKVEGIDKELVGHVAAEIRRLRPPEPYKGKGVRYQGERVRRKAGKTGAK